MKAIEIRNKFIQYFIRNNHKQIPSASVIPENDASVLFTTAGMQQLVPYLLGDKHPEGNMLVDYQKCVRTVDIDEVGDNRHLTFFEMLGNWSLGAYFKEQSIRQSFEFLTEELNIPKEKLIVTVFEGDEDAPRDEESANAWKKMGMLEENIYYFPKSENWWIAGEEGPCGPDTEIFYYTGDEKVLPKYDPDNDDGTFVEIWNNVFMEYFKTKDGYTKLEQKNVDTGMGLERITMLLEGKETPFDLEMFEPIMTYLKEHSKKDIISSRRIVSDHLRCASIIIADGGVPKNTDSGYILRRLIRRSVRHLNKMDFNLDNMSELIDVVIKNNMELYSEVKENEEKIINIISEETKKFLKTLIRGEREFEKLVAKKDIETTKKMGVEDAFKLYETYGLPIEITMELAEERNIEVEKEKLNELFEKHQARSREGSKQKFKGGLANHNEKTIKYHTATHLLHHALREVLGKDTYQKGSNITEERLRFDFAFDRKLTDEEKQKIEDMVNEAIKKGMEVTVEEMTPEEAHKKGAIGLFDDTYGDLVTVYTIGDGYSMEICMGPHVKNTKELGKFKIVKEQSSSKGVRRIKAILEDN